MVFRETNAPTAPAPPAADAPAWDDALLKDPHAVADKRSRVQRMFAAIAPSYDLNNRLHSLWMDQAWRRKAVKLAGLKPTDRVVDVACGTGDLTLMFAVRRCLHSIENKWTPPIPAQFVGIDFTYEMLPFARGKSEQVGEETSGGEPAAWLWPRIVQFVNGDAQSLPLPDACCDVVSIAFGIRNVAEPERALRELARVLRPGGRLAILEFGQPRIPGIRTLYAWYFRYLLPLVGRTISKHRSAYSYLPASVGTFPPPAEFARVLAASGFSGVRAVPLTFGIVYLFTGERGPEDPLQV